MDWSSIIKKEWEYLKLQKQNEITRIWHENQLAVSVIAKTTETNCAKWNNACLQISANTTNGEDREVKAVMLPPHTPSPSMTMWSPISRNFVTTDHEDVKVTPHSNEDAEMDTDERGAKCESINDEMFVSLVRRMIPYRSSTTAMSSTQVIDGLQSVEPKVDEGVPDAVIFETISSYFNGNYTADKYVKITKCNTPSCTPNIDGPLGSVIQPFQSLRAYRKYLCRRCCIYNCQLHPPVKNIDETLLMRKNTVDELQPFTEPCSNTCYKIASNTTLLQNTTTENTTANNIAGDVCIAESMKDIKNSFDDLSLKDFALNLSDILSDTFDETFQGFLSESSTQTFQSPDTQIIAMDVDKATDPESEWSFADQSHFLVLFNDFPHNCCAISKAMGKSCEQVYKKMVSMDPPPPVRKEIEKKSGPKERFYGELQEHLVKTYFPCNHPEPCSNTTNCLCQNCQKYCSCGLECTKRIPKCSCKISCTTLKCICHSDQRECDSECGCHSCKNKEIQSGRRKPLRVVPSSIHGWGVVVAASCLKGDFISEYKGEIISIRECERREKVFDAKHCCTYTFSLNGDSVIDARFFGNELRFLNFSEKPNCYCRVMMVNGDHRIGVYAASNIAAGDELTIDYLTYDPTVAQ